MGRQGTENDDDSLQSSKTVLVNIGSIIGDSIATAIADSVGKGNFVVVESEAQTTHRVNVRQIRTRKGENVTVYSKVRSKRSARDNAGKELAVILPREAFSVFFKSSSSSALISTAVTDSAYQPGPRARALLRGARQAEETLRTSGGAFSLEEVQQLLGNVSRQAVAKRIREGSLLAVPGPSNQRSYPAIQFLDNRRPVAGLKAVKESLGTDNAWALLDFLVQPDGRLGGRKPIDVLKAGDVQSVVESAKREGLQGG